MVLMVILIMKAMVLRVILRKKGKGWMGKSSGRIRKRRRIVVGEKKKSTKSFKGKRTPTAASVTTITPITDTCFY